MVKRELTVSRNEHLLILLILGLVADTVVKRLAHVRLSQFFVRFVCNPESSLKVKQDNFGKWRHLLGVEPSRTDCAKLTLL